MERAGGRVVVPGLAAPFGSEVPSEAIDIGRMMPRRRRPSDHPTSAHTRRSQNVGWVCWKALGPALLEGRVIKEGRYGHIIHRARHARGHSGRHGSPRNRRILGWVHEPDARQLHDRSSDLHCLVLRPPPRTARRDPRPSGVVRPGDGNRRQDALHRRPTDFDAVQLLPLLPRRRQHNEEPGRERASPESRLRVTHTRSRPQRTRRTSRPGRSRHRP